MNKRVIGGDVCKSSIVCWELFEIPTDLRCEFKKNKRTKKTDPLTFCLNRESVKEFVEFLEDADALVMEPTGGNYSFLWAKIAESHKIFVRWVGHPEVKYLRKSERLPDKNDQADALALAVYALKNWDKPHAFLRFEPGLIKEISDRYLQLHSISRIQSPIINRLRQQLAKEFPEIASIKSTPGPDGLSPLWAWITERERYTDVGEKLYNKKYQNSVAPQYGVEISEFTKFLANQLCDLHLSEFGLRRELTNLIYSQEFQKFNEVFDLYGFGLMARAMLLIRCYPLSRFESEGAFKRRLGFGSEERSSGEIERFRAAGSSLARKELYLWCLTVVGKKRLISGVGLEIMAKFEHHKQQLQKDSTKGKKFTNLVRSRTVAFMLRRLFRDLKNNCTD
ncbi:MAG: IS110 family transposase [Okeania sp. SIO3B5]|uniref:IS110 family transposase n=1 Tax=Okeania sp. SIO3B5 TaxID=2607811 RepID=UPI0013FFA212|nr:transposase [Okeania sp. SIO3B5]NEO51877.1 IS110 family transposase [Okeania sp. SIO3B5]